MTMKYLLKTALCLLLCALLSLPALAEEGEELTCGDYTYVLLEDGGARITGYDGEDAELTVPAELDGHPVREIGNDAFYGCESLTAVTLPIGLTSIGENPFRSSDLLAKINVSPDDPVFAQIDGVLYEKATKTLISYPAGKEGNSFAVPDGILAIGDRAFIGCDSLTTVTLPEGLTTIGDEAFYGCSSLTTVTLPEGLTSIGDSAFSNCSSLTSVTLPDSLTSIGANPFTYCPLLEKISVSPDHPVFEQFDGVLYEKATRTLICCPAGKAGDTFAVPDGTLTIGDYAFACCNSLTTVTLPEGLASIGDSAFSFCESLTAVTLPNSLTSIGKNPFSSCSSLAKIDISPDHPVFAQIDGVLYEKESKTLICCPARKEGDSFAVPDGILAIGDRAFYGCETLTTITLPKGLTSIGDSAFSGCTSLTSVTLPNSLTSIGDGAFFRCDALTSVSMPKGLTAIGDRAFACCESLTSVTLPDSLVSIGEGAFKNCPDDLTLTVPRDSYARQYAIDNGLTYTYPDANDWLYA